jgi:hypothetical protein
MPSEFPAEPFAFNGVDGASGQYLTPSLTEHDLATLAQGKPLTQPEAPVNSSPRDEQEARHLNELAWRHRVATEATFAPIEGVDAKNLAEAGWGVVFAVDANPAVREALAPLLEHRRSLAAAQVETRYRELTGGDGVRPNDTKNAFLARHGAGPGPVDPDTLPYYLLLVGSPQAIPYRFQYHLDVQHAIGRIHFVDENGADDLDAYANYARGVIAAETEAPVPRRAVFVGVQNPDDKATTLSAAELVQPLADKVAADQPGWQLQTLLGDAAKKEDLKRVLGGGDTPALLFTASHGVGFPADDPRQLPHQGALLCQDWPGPTQHQGEIPQDFYFAGDDLGADARLLGLIAFHFACYGAGTPQLDDFAHSAFTEPKPIAPHPFVAALPQRLLGHPNGGALAVVGHVERAWGYSFLWQQTGRQLGVFSSTLKRLMDGHPIGSAVEFFNERYAELATTLSSELEDVKFGKIPDEYGLAEMWTAHNDARSYAIVGDPAVRLVVGNE